MTNRADQRSSARALWRLAIPPGVSIGVHVALVGVLAVVGTQLVTIETERGERESLSELDLTPGPPIEQPRAADRAPTPGPAQAARPARASTPTPGARADEVFETRAQIAPVRADEVFGRGESALSAPETDALARQPRESAIRFAGVKTAAAQRIVYVIDGSGATTSSFSYIKERLLQSIDRLSATQRFQVIVFREREDSVVEVAPIGGGTLPRATLANKLAVSDWLGSMRASGRSNPLDGLGAALELDPDLVLLISRAIERTAEPWAGGLGVVRATLDELNPLDKVRGTRPTVIKTIQLLDEDPTGIMRAIGTLHGDGANDYQVISYDRLARPDTAHNRPSTDDEATELVRAAQDALWALGSDGALERTLAGAPTRPDARRVLEAGARVRDALSGVRDDERATLLLAQSALLSANAGERAGSDTLRAHARALASIVFLDPDIDARRRLTIAMLLAAIGERERSLNTLMTILIESDELGLSEQTVGRVSLCAIALTGSLDQSPILDDPSWRTLAAWCAATTRLEQARSDALAPVLDPRLVDPAKRDALLGMIHGFARDRDIELGSLAAPDDARLVFAELDLRDPGRIDDALSVLRSIGSSNTTEVGARALWLLCLGAHSDRDPELLARAALDLVGRYPDHERAGDALVGAVDAGRSVPEALRVELLRTALARTPNAIGSDLWRLELAGLADPGEMARLVEAMTPNTRESDLGSELYDDHERASIPDDDRAALAQAQRVARVLTDLGSKRARWWSVRAAELEMESDPGSAAARLGSIAPDPDPEVQLDLDLMRAEALIRSGQRTRGVDALNALVARTERGGARYWRAWTMLIETAAHHGSADDRARAGAHLVRLSLIDPELGGEPTRSRLESARELLHSEP